MQKSWQPQRSLVLHDRPKQTMGRLRRPEMLTCHDGIALEHMTYMNIDDRKEYDWWTWFNISFSQICRGIAITSTSSRNSVCSAPSCKQAVDELLNCCWQAVDRLLTSCWQAVDKLLTEDCSELKRVKYLALVKLPRNKFYPRKACKWRQFYCFLLWSNALTPIK